MATTPLRAHKGLDNKLLFRVLGPDRIPYNVQSNQQVYARIIDPENNTVVIEKLCKLGPAVGLITLELNGGDIATVHAGMYSIVLIRTEDFVVGIPDYYVEKPLYVDMANNVGMTLEITEQAFRAPIKSVTYNAADWTQGLNVHPSGLIEPSFYTGRIPGGRILNHTNSVHSFSTYTENFTGKLEAWGSLEEAPDPYVSDTRWFKIYPSTMSQDIEYIGYTGTQAWTFQANFMWIKFRYTPSTAVLDAGKFVRLIVRV
jgi:hypothetical protein